MEEAGREDGFGLGGKEGGPCLAVPVGCGVDASVVEDLPDGRWRQRVAKTSAACLHGTFIAGVLFGRRELMEEVIYEERIPMLPVWALSPAALVAAQSL